MLPSDKTLLFITLAEVDVTTNFQPLSSLRVIGGCDASMHGRHALICPRLSIVRPICFPPSLYCVPASEVQPKTLVTLMASLSWVYHWAQLFGHLSFKYFDNICSRRTFLLLCQIQIIFIIARPFCAFPLFELSWEVGGIVETLARLHNCLFVDYYTSQSAPVNLTSNDIILTSSGFGSKPSWPNVRQ